MVFELNKVSLRLVTVVKRYIPTRADTYQIFSLTLLLALLKVKVFLILLVKSDIKNQTS